MLITKHYRDILISMAYRKPVWFLAKCEDNAVSESLMKALQIVRFVAEIVCGRGLIVFTAALCYAMFCVFHNILAHNRDCCYSLELCSVNCASFDNTSAPSEDEGLLQNRHNNQLISTQTCVLLLGTQSWLFDIFFCLLLCCVNYSQIKLRGEREKEREKGTDRQ